MLIAWPAGFLDIFSFYKYVDSMAGFLDIFSFYKYVDSMAGFLDIFSFYKYVDSMAGFLDIFSFYKYVDSMAGFLDIFSFYKYVDSMAGFLDIFSFCKYVDSMAGFLGERQQAVKTVLVYSSHASHHTHLEAEKDSKRSKQFWCIAATLAITLIWKQRKTASGQNSSGV
ncbi:hypothetical protein RRG08_002814 [Elysia crispata]|uniref:Uncharacterized protein n=1 Tax=Elysia crispata TaxID=231223 RepID=A0AAE0XU77_9GAST|nr:hypothetical protein RRG08_002814 [Elysia crispata]